MKTCIHRISHVACEGMVGRTAMAVTVAGSILALATSPASADIFSWTGAGSDNNFGTAGNWSNVTFAETGGGTLPDPGEDGIPDATDRILLRDDAPDAAQTINLEANHHVKDVVMRATGNRSYTINPSNPSLILTLHDQTFAYGSLVGNSAPFIVNTRLETNDDNLVFLIRMADAAAPTLQLNGQITGVGGANFARITVQDESSGGTESVLLAQNNTNNRLNIVDSAEVILGSAAAAGVLDGGGEHVLTFTLDDGSLPIASVRGVDVTTPGNVSFVGGVTGTIRINQAVNEDRMFTVAGRVLGSGTLVLGEAVGGGSGHLTVRVASGLLSGTVAANLAANTTLELAPDEQRTLSSTVSGDGRLVISGPSRLVITSPTTHTGGTQITGGEVRVLDPDSTLGNGNVSMSPGTLLELLDTNGSLLNVISDTATLSLDANGGSFAHVFLHTGLNEVVGALLLDGVAQGAGTYGSTSSAATFQNDNYFSGSGIITVNVIPEPATVALVGLGVVLVTPRRRTMA